MGRLTYQALCENVVDVIRMKIFNHELAPEAKIIEQNISGELGVSRGPTRGALRQPEQEGLVEYMRDVGCSVKNITLEGIYEIYLLRVTYEILVVKLCGGVFSETAFAEMDAALESMRDLKETDYNKSIACGNISYEIIMCPTGLLRLVKGWTGLNYENAINYYAGNPDGRAIIERQYPIRKELVDVCHTGNTEKICEVISNHYMKTIRRRLKEQGVPGNHFRFSVDVIDGWV